MENKLVILDLNGLLVRKLSINDHTGRDVIKTRSFIFNVRPGAREFIKNIMSNYNLAIWTSTTYSNAAPIIDGLFNNVEKSKLAFIWMRDHVNYDPDFGKSDNTITEYDTVKILDNVFQNAMFQRKWTSKNTVIIDDSWSKLRFNDKSNTIVTENYNDTSINHITMEELMKIINEKFASLI